MNWDAITIVVVFIVGAFFSVVGYLLMAKDAAQESRIVLLFAKHEEDAAKLQTLEVKIADTHYQKTDVNRLVDSLTLYFDKQFFSLREILKDHTK